MNRIDTVKEHLQQGYNCGQAILAGFAEDYGIARESALKLAYNLGGGCARQGEICGAVSAALLVYSLRFGSDRPGDELPEEVVHQLSEDHIREFSLRFGSTHCKDLLGYDIRNPEGFARIVEDDLFRLKCSGMVLESARILEHAIRNTEAKLNL